VPEQKLKQENKDNNAKGEKKGTDKGFKYELIQFFHNYPALLVKHSKFYAKLLYPPTISFNS
jgi:hypothetical protein